MKDSREATYLERFIPVFNSAARAKQTIIFKNVRISVITDRLVRIEHCRGAAFCDEPTQTVITRDLGDVAYKTEKENSILTLATSKAVFKYNLRTHRMISVALSDGKCVTDYYSGNLKGTCRTLDMKNGSTKLEQGLISRDGVSVLDDSDSLLLSQNGMIVPRPAGQKDEYYFAYGHDYRGCIKALYGISGAVPLVPRFCLGNWWSRYKAYTQQEYKDLMQRFIDERIPITVATIDMDWHWVDVIRRFGKKDAQFQFKPLIPKTPNDLLPMPGWTGYSWNTELFPDYKELLTWLHERGFKVPLNIHPAQGVRPFEDMYEQMAKAMELDPKDKKHIPFDITNSKYLEAYFKVIHEPYENDGVDFWWIDWQQGKNTKVPGLDPLWALNHYHYAANARDGKRPLILSRYCGIGSHRYPLGFSGDTIISWKSLDFQPYFTANAANAGYSWWSHDIGGHALGNRDDELYVRWVQLGVFSPIMRLHSTSNEFSGKEPWKYNGSVEKTAAEFMRLRHRLIPYIYSMNRRTHEDGTALCEPMYYSYPDSKEAYEVPNEYFFGSELICAPITKKASKKTNLAPAKVWLPSGRYTDVFNGRIYDGNKFVTMYRDSTEFPLLAHEGSIIPLSSDPYSNSTQNPESLDILIYRGKGSFTLYEDDGETDAYKNGAYAETVLSVLEGGNDLRFTIRPANGDRSVVPQSRTYKLIFKDIADCEQAIIYKDKKVIETHVTRRNGYVSLTLKRVNPDSRIDVVLKYAVPTVNTPHAQAASVLISKFQLPPDLKLVGYSLYMKNPNGRIPSQEPYRGPLEELKAMKY